MAEINLLRGEKKHGPGLNLQMPAPGRPVIWILLAILLLCLSGFTVFYFLHSKVQTELAGTKARAAEVEKSLQSPSPEVKEAIKAQAALSFLSGLLDKHLHWTYLWDALAKHTLKTVQYLSISATVEKSDFIVEGRVNNYEELGKLMLGLQSSSDFSRVELVSSGPSDGEVIGLEFSLAVKYRPSLLLNLPESSQTFPDKSDFSSKNSSQ